MKDRMTKLGWIVALVVTVLVPAVFAQDERDDDRYRDSDNYQRQYDNSRSGEPMRIDRYLDVQVWPNRDDAEYYSGDNIVINFRANRDCFVAIYSVDSRGRVNLLFPNDPSDDNFVTGGVTYHIPGGNDRYDLVVDGPSGREHLQMIASREKFPIPNWYRNSGIVCDNDDRDEFMDNLNDRYFVRYPGQRFAVDRAVLFVKDWEPEYYRPIYSPYYPDWAVCGNVYVDYPWGGSVYINGIYWGVAPLYIPRLVVGWHVITVYDPWGYCWESDFHCGRYNTVVFDRTVVKTSKVVVSRYKEVNVTKWRDPVRNGYPNYKPVVVDKNPRGGAVVGIGRLTDKGEKLGEASIDTFRPLSKKYTRGETGLVKTDRGFEAIGESKGIRGAEPGSLDRTRSHENGNTRIQPFDREQPRDNGSTGYRERSRGDFGNTSRDGATEQRREGERTRVVPAERQPDNSGSTEQRREQPKAERRTPPAPANPAPAPQQRKEPERAKEAPKQNPQSAPERAKGGDNDNGGGRGKRPH